MEADIAVNNSTTIWVGSSDNLSFVVAMKPAVGKTIVGVPMSHLELRLLAEDLTDGSADHLFHVKLSRPEAYAVGNRLNAIVDGWW